MDLKVGMPAPDFTLPLATFGTIALSNMRGKPVILYFYPKDDTPGCTTEACEFRDSLARFADFDAAVIGISKDSVESHAAFARKFGLNFHLASDAAGRTCEEYGVWGLKSVYGEPTMGIERATFLIDRHGIIRYIWRKVTALGHAEEVRAMTEALHHGKPLPGDTTPRETTAGVSASPPSPASASHRSSPSPVVVPLPVAAATSAPKGPSTARAPVAPPAAAKPAAKVAAPKAKESVKTPLKPAAKSTSVPAKKPATSKVVTKKPAGGKKKPTLPKSPSGPVASKKKKPIVGKKPAPKTVKKPTLQSKTKKPAPKVAAKKPAPSRKKPSPPRKVSSAGAKKIVKKVSSSAKKKIPATARRK